MSDVSKVWTTVGSAGTLNQADLAKVTLHRSIIQLGAEFPPRLPHGVIAQPADEVGNLSVTIPNIQAVVRYNVTPVDGLFITGTFSFRYALQLRFRGHVIARLVEVDLESGAEVPLVLFDRNNSSSNFQVQTEVATEPSTVMDFSHKAYYIEATLIAPAIAIGHPAEISIIKIVAVPTLLGSPLGENPEQPE